ncbi:MAG: M48 family metallopeptidase [bacterium]|nr:M48 family metallopeptidase [bacterium]
MRTTAEHPRIPSNGAPPARPVAGGCDAPTGEGGLDGADLPPALQPLAVEVIRSANRRKTISARLAGGTLEIRIPAWMSEADEAEAVERFRRRFDERRRCWGVDLSARARDLAARHALPEARSIRWSTRQRRRWGSCNTATGEVLISHRLTEVPPWVLDYVIVHELAHLREAGHSAAFDALVARYPLTERAKGYLEAFGAWADGGAEESPESPVAGSGRAVRD